ncbi:MAG TPA: hypothetical protein VF062_28225 [Candidatus Limnocylindrales bacterium]
MSNARKATGAKAPAPLDIAALLGEDGRPERTVHLCLRGHLQAQWDVLQAHWAAAPGDDEQALMVERARKRRIAEEMAAVEAEMRAGTVPFRLRALPRRRTPGMPADQVVWHELIEKHPPRRDDKGKANLEDLRAGFNVESTPFWDTLVRASVVEPELTPTQWDQLDSKLTDGQYGQLITTALHLNRDGVDVPFSRAASMTRTSDTESRRQSDSASPSAASKVGSRGRSRSTSTTSKAA